MKQSLAEHKKHKTADETELIEPKELESRADVSVILDEIDEVLEENAVEFVRSYIQEGGQ